MSGAFEIYYCPTGTEVYVYREFRDREDSKLSEHV